MKKEMMDLLVKAGEELDIALDPREDYSGRGMYGDKTCGIVIENVAKLPAVAATAALLSADGDEEYTADDLVRDLLKLRMDSMGHDTIVY